MRRTRFLLTVVAGLALAGAGHAATLSPLFTTQTDYQNYMSGTIGVDHLAGRLAVGIARVGNNAPGSTGWSAGWEAGLFVPNPADASGGQGSPGNTVWPTGPVPFTFSRAGDILSFSVGTFYTGTWQDPIALGIDTLAIQTQTQAPGRSVGANSLTWSDFDFTPAPGFNIPGQTAKDGEYIAQVISEIAAGDFSLTGFITLAFDPAARPDASQLAFRIAAFDTARFPAPVPAPAAIGIMAIGLLGLIGAAGRRRA